MRTNGAKAKLQAGESVVGVFVPIPSPTVIELCGLGGFDLIVIDCEHGPANPQSVEDLLRAAENVGVPAITRIAQNTQQVILRYMDGGSLGVLMPMVNRREDAERLVHAVKYLPEGRRGLASVRAAGYGLVQPLGEYVREANAQTMVVAQIETMEAVNNLDDLLQVPHIDVFFIGPTDLSQSLGLPGQTQDPRVREVITHARERIQAAGRAAGFMVSDVAGARRALDDGFRFVTVNATGLIGRAAKAFVTDVRA